jgi:hypothetical protein
MPTTTTLENRSEEGSGTVAGLAVAYEKSFMLMDSAAELKGSVRSTEVKPPGSVMPKNSVVGVLAAVWVCTTPSDNVIVTVPGSTR